MQNSYVYTLMDIQANYNTDLKLLSKYITKDYNQYTLFFASSLLQGPCHHKFPKQLVVFPHAAFNLLSTVDNI